MQIDASKLSVSWDNVDGQTGWCLGFTTWYRNRDGDSESEFEPMRGTPVWSFGVEGNRDLAVQCLVCMQLGQALQQLNS